MFWKSETINFAIFSSPDLTVYSFKLDPYLQSLLNWDVRKCALRLLNSLLIYCFQPVSRHSFCDLKSLPHENIAPETLASDMSRLLDDADAVDHKMVNGVCFIDR